MKKHLRLINFYIVHHSVKKVARFLKKRLTYYYEPLYTRLRVKSSTSEGQARQQTGA